MVPTVVCAQTGSATINGIVRDLSGAPIAEANVYGIDSENIKRRISTTTDSAGRFRFSNLRPGTYELRAYKESEGYPDTFFAFFYAGNSKNWKSVRVDSGRTLEGFMLQLGPKYARLKLLIMDEKGNSVGGGVWFRRAQDVKRIYGVGVAPNAELLVPPVPFRFEIEKEGYALWRSKLITLQSGQTLSITARLKRR
jgi:hypothetical protein